MLQPEFKPLINILQGKLFRIPEYQRHYSWQTKHREDLFDDIKRLQEQREKNKNVDRIHFMATLVCLKKKDTPESIGANMFYHYDVVDGQQRLTTLIILLKSISIKLKEHKNRSYEDLDRLVVKDDKMLIILQNNQDSHGILRQYLERGKKPKEEDIRTHADKNLDEAIKDCEKFVDQYDSSSKVVNLLILVQNFLYFVFQQIDDEGAVYTIFEVLNSRGLEVDLLDKCKSLLMGLLYESAPDEKVLDAHTSELLCIWTAIYKHIGQKNIPGHEIVRFAATLKTQSGAGRPLSAEDALKFFKDDCEDSDSNNVIDRIFKNTKWLGDITSRLAKLYGNNKMQAVTDVTQARLLAVSIMLRDDLSDKEQNQLFEQWERTTFKLYGFWGKDARYKVGDYVRLAKTIQKDSSIGFKELLGVCRIQK